MTTNKERFEQALAAAQAKADAQKLAPARKKKGTKAKAREQVVETAEAPSRQPDPNAPVILGPGGPTVAGWSSIEAVARCMKEYQFEKVRMIRAPVSQTPDALAIGAMFHAYRAYWYFKRFDTSAKTLAACHEHMLADADTLKLPVSPHAKVYTHELAEKYVQHWSTRPRPNPVAAEYELGPAPLEKGDAIFSYRTARLDDVSYYPEAGGKLAIGEAKTTGDSVAAVMNQYQLHGQPLLQLLLWKMAPQGEAMHGPVAGFVIDAIKKPYERSKPDFARKFFPVNDAVLSWYAQSLKFYLRMAAAIEWDADVPRNTAMCTRLIGRMRAPCKYRDLCASGRGAAFSYVLEGGEALTKHKPVEGRRKMPWE